MGLLERGGEGPQVGPDTFLFKALKEKLEGGG